MTLVTRPILLSILFCLALSSAPALAEGEADEIATPAEVAQLDALLEKLEGRVEAQLQARVDALIEGWMERDLAARTAALLEREGPLVGTLAVPRPAAGRLLAGDGPEGEMQIAYDTTCMMVDGTFECVLMDSPVR